MALESVESNSQWLTKPLGLIVTNGPTAIGIRLAGLAVYTLYPTYQYTSCTSMALAIKGQAASAQLLSRFTRYLSLCYQVLGARQIALGLLYPPGLLG